MRVRGALLVAGPLALALGGCGARGTRDVEQVLDALQSGSERQRARAVRTLAEHGRAILQPLSDVLTGEDAEALGMSEDRRQALRVPAARALGIIAQRASLARTEAENAAKPLLAALDDPSRSLRIEAVTALGYFTQLSEPVNDVILLLREEDPKVAEAAIAALRRNALQATDRLVPPEEPLVTVAARADWDRLLERLESTDDDIRLEAVRELGSAEPAEAMPVLLTRLARDKSSEIRYTALRIVLARVREQPEAPFVREVVEQLARTFRKDDDSRVVLRAAQELRRRGRDLAAPFLARIRRAVEACEERLLADAGEEGRQKYDAATRSDAIHALRNLHSERRDRLLAELVAPETGEPVRIRRAAARVLANAQTAIATRALGEAMEDEDSIVKLVAAQALGRRGDLEAVTYLVDLLSHKETKIRTPAADNLGTLGEKALPVLIQQLAASLDRAEKLAQWQVPLRELLAKEDLSREERRQVDTFQEAIREFREQAEGRKEKHIAWGITSGLGRIAAEIGPEAAAPARDVLLRSARCHYADVRRVAANALGNLRGPEVIAALIVLLGDPDPTVAWYASGGLEKHGSDAVPALCQALGREATAAPAARTLGRLGAAAAIPPLLQQAPKATGKARVILAWALGELLARHPESPQAAAVKDFLRETAQAADVPEAARVARYALDKCKGQGIRGGR